MKLVKLFIGERWPIHVALARMRGMSSSMESKPRLLNIAMPSLSRRYIDFQTDRPRHPRGYRDFLPRDLFCYYNACTVSMVIKRPAPLSLLLFLFSLSLR